eukprot:TRINITY_DN82485_c0_g1_i1.p1 TRINITY_DN82485_c0_g1~~TRINITY_DN82485_c0_g1_i1.p1  ORF type:complete len:537 (+),score=139.79 TRINITY_DN82485_c0_g1_i1:89-1699(+)
MLQYGGDAYTAYMSQYGADDGWTWDASSWGATGYDQMSSEVPYSWDGGWGYDEQWGASVSASSEAWGNTAATGGADSSASGANAEAAAISAAADATGSSEGPKCGAELLTDLRLAELKRLIDRDAKALRSPAEGSDFDCDFWGSSAPSRATTRAPESNEDTPEKLPESSEDGLAGAIRRRVSLGGVEVEGVSAAEAAAKALAEEIQADLTNTSAVAAVASPAAEDTDAVMSNETEELPELPSRTLEVVPEVQEVLQEVHEQLFVCLADFMPETRDYGELPLRTGEEVFVSGEVSSGWIFGVKRGPKGIEEGWLPASALGIGDTDDEDKQEEEEILPPPVRTRWSHGGRRGRDHREDLGHRHREALGGYGGGRSSASSASASKGGGARGDRSGGKAAGSSLKEDNWYEHGNWWSKQRHLSLAQAPKMPPPPPVRQPAPLAPTQRPGHQRNQASDERARLRGGKAPAAAGSGKQPSKGGQRNAGERGGGGSAAAGQAGSNKGSGKPAPADTKRERPHRDRPALTSMLDRLNKPLELKK